MTSLEKVKAEVERLKAQELAKKDNCKRNGLERIMAKIGVINEVLSFIDSLESPCKDCPGDNQAGTCASISGLGQCRLELNRNSKESINFDKKDEKFIGSEGLRLAAEIYYEQDCPYAGEARVINNEHDIWFPSEAIEDAFKAGAEWQKEQMKKEYVDIGRASVIGGKEGNEIFFDDFKRIVGNTFQVGDRLEIKAIKHVNRWTQS